MAQDVMRKVLLPVCALVAASCGEVTAQSKQIGASFRGVGEMMPADTRGGLWFGFSLSASASFVAVGAPNAGDHSEGGVYLFEVSGTRVSEVCRIDPPDPTGDDDFGYAVALDGDLLLVGAPDHDGNGPDSGAAYLFRRSAGSWVLESKLLPGDAAEKEQFGWSVALGRGTAVVGLHRDRDNVDPEVRSGIGRKRGQGSVYVFSGDNGQWRQTARLVPDEWKTSDDGFGQSVAIDGDTLVVGAYLDDVAAADSGSVYLFERRAGTWAQEARLTAGDSAEDSGFGRRVALDGDTLVVGARGSYNYFLDSGRAGSEIASGAAYIFSRGARGWVESAKLEPEDGADGDAFGSAIDVDGNRVIVGATASERKSYVIVYVGDGEHWEGVARFLQADRLAGNYGSSVVLGLNHAFFGAFSKTTADGSGAGIVYFAY